MWTAERKRMIGGMAALGALALLLPRWLEPVSLTEQRVQLDANPDRVFDQLTVFGEGPRILQRSRDEIIAEFPIQMGWYRVTTLERITLDPSRRQVIFKQLRSPFFCVRTATEVFDLAPRPGGGTLITLHGVLWPRLGLFGRIITQRVVKPRWDAIDAKFLGRLRERV